MKIAKAQIEWSLPKKEIPSISKKFNDNWIYNPIIVFKNQYNTPIWHNNETLVPLWTCIVQNESIEEKISIAKIRYLSEDAPQELLKLGAEFELFDGNRNVAKGTIIEIMT